MSLPANLSYAGKTALVTGANCGLGYEIALLLLQLEVSTLIITVRSAEKGEVTKQRLFNDPHVKALKVQPTINIYIMDMLSHESVVEFGKKVAVEVEQLDIAILNAGMWGMSFQTSPYTGNECITQVNYLSTAMLALFILPVLRKSSRSSSSFTPRLTIVSSIMQTYSPLITTPIPPETPILSYMNDKSKFAGAHRYSDTKLLVGLFTRALAAHVDRNEVVVNDMCPGMTQSELERDLHWTLYRLSKLVRWFIGKSTKKGAELAVGAISMPGDEGHGKFVSSGTIKTVPFEDTEEGKGMSAKIWIEVNEMADRLIPGSSLQELATER